MKSTVLAIGGGELAHTQELLLELSRFAEKHSKKQKIAIMTVATEEPDEAIEKYSGLFRELGFAEVSNVNVSERDAAFNEKNLDNVRSADVLFFTGGDQLHITSLLGGSPVDKLLHERFREGLVIVGTSAGAAMMSHAIILEGDSDSPPRVGGVEIAPGLGLIANALIDTHFSQRGRHGRLLTAIAHHPHSLGVGIDEDTAIVVKGTEFRVVGEGVVTVLNGANMRHSNLSDRDQNETLGLFGVNIDVLPSGYRYDLKKRQPRQPEQDRQVDAASA